MNDQSEVPKLWAAKGEVVTCVNGDPICEVAHDIFVDDAHDPSHFTNWRQAEPARLTQINSIRCAECRGVWIRQNGNGSYSLHFSDGWR